MTIHRSVMDMSKQMLFEMKRHNYVTPTNYLELVSGYKGLLDGKRKELGDSALKLRNGLFKIDETREKVMTHKYRACTVYRHLLHISTCFVIL